MKFNLKICHGKTTKVFFFCWFCFRRSKRKCCVKGMKNPFSYRTNNGIKNKPETECKIKITRVLQMEQKTIFIFFLLSLARQHKCSFFSVIIQQTPTSSAAAPEKKRKEENKKMKKMKAKNLLFLFYTTSSPPRHENHYVCSFHNFFLFFFAIIKGGCFPTSLFSSSWMR
jgi:hypothetical protein